MTDHAHPAGDKKTSSFVKSSQDLGAGLFLIAVALFAYWQALELPAGSLRAMGAGMLPQALAILVGLGGVSLVVSGLLVDGDRLQRWSLRGPIFVFGGIILFALLIRTCGLIVAGPVAMIVGSLASDEFRLKESLIFSAIMTGFCILLFKTLLRLPIPVIGPVIEPFFPF